MGPTQFFTYDRYPRLARWASPRVRSDLSEAFEASADLEADHHLARIGVTTFRLQQDYTRKRMKKV